MTEGELATFEESLTKGTIPTYSPEAVTRWKEQADTHDMTHTELITKSIKKSCRRPTAK